MEELKMTLEKVINLLADHLEMDASEITEATTFEDLGVDSLDTVEIMMEMEDEFNEEISDEVAEQLTTVGKAVEYIKTKV